MSSHPEEDLALAFLTFVEAGAIPTAMNLFARDAAVSLPGQRNISAAEFREFLEYSTTLLAFNSLVLRWTDINSESNRVVIEAEARALLRDGMRYENRYLFLFVVRDGRIHRLTLYAEQPLADVLAWHGRDGYDLFASVGRLMKGRRSPLPQGD